MGMRKGNAYKKSKETVDKIMQSLRDGNTRTCAALCAGISYDTFKIWFDADTDFGDKVKAAEAECEARCMRLVQQAAITTWQAAAWWLERARRTTYSRSLTIDLSKLPDDQVRALAAGTSEDRGS